MRLTFLRRAPTYLMLVAVLVAACAPSAPPAQPTAGPPPAGNALPPRFAPDQRVTISFTNYNLATAGLGKEATEQLLSEFNQQFPNVEVQVRPVPSQDLISKTQAEFGGRMYGVPYVFSTPTLFYNADLFRLAGLDPDHPPTTWKEVKQYGLQIKQRTGKLGIDIGCLGRFDWCFQGLVLSNGGRVLSEDRTRLTFGEPPAGEAVAMWQDLVKSGVHASSALSTTDGFQGGNAAMMLNTSALQSSLLAASKGKWELRTAAMPAFEGKPVRPTNSGSALFILSNDPAKQRAAWELMKFLTSEHGYTIIQSKIGYLPLRPSIVQDPRYLKDWVAANPLVTPNLKQLDSLEPWVAFPGPNYQNVRATIMTGVQDRGRQFAHEGPIERHVSRHDGKAAGRGDDVFGEPEQSLGVDHHARTLRNTRGATVLDNPRALMARKPDRQRVLFDGQLSTIAEPHVRPADGDVLQAHQALALGYRGLRSIHQRQLPRADKPCGVHAGCANAARPLP